MAAQSTEQRELQLVESVEFKILAVANKEEKLSQLLQRYLAPIILKASSEHSSVRTRVIQILGRLKTFIQPPGIVLPVAALLDQFKAASSSLIQQLDLSFISHSIERIDDDDRRDLIPKALQGISQPGNTALYNIVLRLLLDIRIPPRGSKDDEKFRDSIGLSNAADAKQLAQMLGLFFRLRAPTGANGWNESNPSLSAGEVAYFSVDSPSSYKIFTRMSELKAKLVTFLASGAFTDEEKFLPALYAAASFDNRVSSSAEEIVKRSTVSMDDVPVVKRLFEAHSLLPAAYRTRILGMLSKSATSTTMSEDIMAVVNLDFQPQTDSRSSTSSLQPGSALEKTKLHKALFQYLSWVAQVGPSKEGFTIGSQLIQHMRSYIELQGWPVPHMTAQDEMTLRSKAYETIGMLCRNANMPVESRLDLAHWLFRSLSEDSTPEAVVNIDGALSSLTASVPPSVGGLELGLKAMLLRYMTLSDEKPAVRSTRHAAVKWANQCLPFADICGRWIDILAIAGQPNERNDVIEQGQKGLDPWTYFAHAEKETPIPDWKSIISLFFGSLITPDSVPETLPSDGNYASTSQKVLDDNFTGSRLPAMAVTLNYCKRLIYLSAVDDFQIEPNWMQALEARVRSDVKARGKIRDYLIKSDEGSLTLYLRACLAGAYMEESPIKEDCMRCFVDIASLSPNAVLGNLVGQSQGLLSLVKANNKEIRALAARSIGILVPHPGNAISAIENWRKTLEAHFEHAEKAVGSEMNAAEGALVAYGHLCSRSVYYDHAISSDSSYPFHFLVDDQTPPALFDSALESFAQLWLAGLATPTSEGPYAMTKVVDRLTTQATKGNEKAITALGKLAVGYDGDETIDLTSPASDSTAQNPLGTILHKLFALHEIKRVEVQFTVGDAITATIARWDSDQVKLTMDVQSRATAFQKRLRSTVITQVLDKLFKDCKATKPSLLKASGIWLFCIVQYCSHLEEVQNRLREAQAAFMRLLSARDELVQETASRALSLVYERGDPELKSALVKDLVSAFTGSGTQLKVEQDTELFEPGALPTGEGSSVTSYKDIVNLANEVGDQRLVYKFMSLAANAATWSTRSAFGRFGLSNILGDSEVDPKLYPKLFRYRFDPNTNVQRSMEDIWKALVKDSGAVLDKHFDAILEDLLKSILGKEWRMREASCAAIADLLQGRPFQQYEKYYGEVWTAALKVLDDVKGSVREAALKLCMTLSNGLVRQLEEGGNTAAAKAMMKEALPFLLSPKGVESSVQDVQVFSTITVIKITKQGGKALKPFIAEMVPQLLGLLSTIEPQQINYHYQRAGEDSRDEIDRLRSQMVNQSPITEAIENCLRFVDADVMADLAPKLEATIKSAIGLPTKIGCSRVLATLFTRHSNDIKPVSSQFLKLMERQAMDKNDEVSQAYARASAYMMRVVPESAKERFLSRLVDMYFEAEEEARRQKIADVIVALAKVSPDHFTAHEAELLPLAYLGMHDTDEYVSKAFKEVWAQHAGSNRTVARYVSEIVALVERCLGAAQWALRHGGAFTIGAMASDIASASTATDQIRESDLKLMWPVFDRALALKTFTGKEKLLVAFTQFVSKGQDLWKKDDQVAAQMKKVAIREAKRNNDEYRVHAFRCLWKFAEARDDLDMLSEIIDIVSPYLDELKDEDKMEVDSKEDHGGMAAKNGLEAIARGYNRAAMREDPQSALSKIIMKLQPYLSSPKFQLIKRDTWYSCVGDLMSETLSDETAKITSSSRESESTAGITRLYIDTLDLDHAEAGTEAQRTQRAKAFRKSAEVGLKRLHEISGADVEQLEGVVTRSLDQERSLQVQEAWKEAKKLLQETGRKRQRTGL